MSLKSLRWDLVRPQGKPSGIDGGQVMANRGNMIDQAQIFVREKLRVRSGIDVERESSRVLPLIDGLPDFGSPHQVGLVGCGRPLLYNLNVIVGATNLMLGAVAAEDGTKMLEAQ